jgi:DMSO/TMAO reductase YedYZ molybdopterin-dependent catalytic subunit
MLRVARVLAALLTLGLPVLVLAQGHPDTLLVVGGDVDQPYVLSAAEFAKLPHTSVVAEGHETKKSTFEGVLLSDLLRRAGVKLGADLRGPRVAEAVVVGAADGYRAVFAIAEVDSGFSDHTILLSDRRDGEPTGSMEGPLRVVATGDKRFARWVRQVTSLTVRKL